MNTDARGSENARVVRLDEVDSTNAEALRRAEDGEKGDLWIVARQQTGGRGRRGRNWVSEPGNLFVSLLLGQQVPPPLAGQLSFVAALALHQAICACAPALKLDLALKWPNDVLARGRKLSGILLERSSVASDPAGEAPLVVGFGVNCISHPEDLPFPATDLVSEGAEVSAEAVLKELIPAFQKEIAAWDGGAGFGAIRDAWLARAAGVGDEIRVTLPNNEEIRGIFDAIDQEGNLIVHVGEWTRKRISAGDVFFIARGDVPGHEE
jgi:BirA family biotin operon repressor/biotin-[acetyl-CoA-carboxylase] ligase